MMYAESLKLQKICFWDGRSCFGYGRLPDATGNESQSIFFEHSTRRISIVRVYCSGNTPPAHRNFVKITLIAPFAGTEDGINAPVIIVLL
jgi:hypothetical protein